MTIADPSKKAMRAAGRGHFQIFAKATGRTGRARASEPPAQVRWRLMAANHRDIGRGAKVHASGDDALSDLRSLLICLPTAHSRLTCRGPVEGWRWEIELDGEPLAQSARGYVRRIECELSLRQFIQVAQTAQIDPSVHVFVRR